tara:strand:+ start:3027 stop:3467 length:441 start_codon:yes stop_codon:yes gene_type:complete
MSIAATITAFQSLHAAVSGVSSAPEKLPATLDKNRLPLVFTWPGPTVQGDGWKPATGWYIHRRLYVIRCYVALVSQQNTGIDDGYQTVVPLLQAFGEAYMGNVNLSGAVAHIGESISDSGASILVYAGTEYHGFEFRIEVSEKVVL